MKGYSAEHYQDDTVFLFYAGQFSQWWASPFIIEGVAYNCSEQYMMVAKALSFGDDVTRDKILLTRGDYNSQAEFVKYPREQKKLGRQVKNFCPNIWYSICRDLVLRGNLAKFSQNPELKELLLSTDDLVLVEASPVDKIWGVGLSVRDVRARIQNQWRGTNWLGEVLMETRDYLK